MRTVANQQAATLPATSNSNLVLNREPSETEQKSESFSNLHSISGRQSSANGSDEKPPTHNGLHDFSQISILPPQQPIRVQPKLQINAPGDKYEREADAMAERVMRMPEPTVQRKCTACEKENEEAIQRQTLGTLLSPMLQRKCAKCEEEEEREKLVIQTKANGSGGGIASPAMTSQIQSARGGGQALDVNTKSFMESRLGTDFSSVRVHSDSRATQMNREINARAFTLGNDIYFSEGQYKPDTNEGKRLLVHELTHTIQQGNSSFDGSWSEMSRVTSTPIEDLSYSPEQISRSEEGTRNEQVGDVYRVEIYIREGYLDLHTNRGVFRYRLNISITPIEGEYRAIVEVNTTNEGGNHSTSLNLEIEEPVLPPSDSQDEVIEFALGSFTIEPNRSNPLSLFNGQHDVTIIITSNVAPVYHASEEERDPEHSYITLEECNSGFMRVRTFPYRGTRLGGAPISAHREGRYIVVEQPAYVLHNNDFRDQTRNLPEETFMPGVGVRLLPNEIVRVHTYEAVWLSNAFGSTWGDNEDEFCVTGEQMLTIAELSRQRTIGNIKRTVWEAATIVPVGMATSAVVRWATPALKRFLGRGSRNWLLAIRIGTSEAAPMTSYGISETGVGLITAESGVGMATETSVAMATETGFGLVTETSVGFVAEAGMNVATETGVGFVAQTGVEVAAAGTIVATEIGAGSTTVVVVDAVGSQIGPAVSMPTNEWNNLLSLSAGTDVAGATIAQTPASIETVTITRNGVDHTLTLYERSTDQIINQQWIQEGYLLEMSGFQNEIGIQFPDRTLSPDYRSPLDSLGRSNRERALQGLSPFLPNGEIVQLHHVDQNFFGTLQEISSVYHRSVNENVEFHPFSGDAGYISWRGDVAWYNGSLRTLGQIYNALRREYWRNRWP